MSELEETSQEEAQHPLFIERGTHVSPYIKLRLERNIDRFSEQVLKKFKMRLEHTSCTCASETRPLLVLYDPQTRWHLSLILPEITLQSIILLAGGQRLQTQAICRDPPEGR